jgi:hypothetical protein
MRIATFIFTITACLISMHVFTQEAVPITHYVFPTFCKGRVFQKSGSVDEAMLNYNVLSREMIFESSPGQYLALADPGTIDSVLILGRIFIPVNNEFYESLTKTAYPLFLQYACTVKEPGSDIGYGMSSVTTASPAIKSLIKSGGAYTLKLPDGFEVMPVYNYWVWTDGRYQKVNNAKQLAAALPAKKETIGELVKKNNTNFSKKQDIVKLVQQL